MLLEFESYYFISHLMIIFSPPLKEKHMMASCEIVFSLLFLFFSLSLSYSLSILFIFSIHLSISILVSLCLLEFVALSFGEFSFSIYVYVCDQGFYFMYTHKHTQEQNYTCPRGGQIFVYIFSQNLSIVTFSFWKGYGYFRVRKNNFYHLH